MTSLLRLSLTGSESTHGCSSAVADRWIAQKKLRPAKKNSIAASEILKRNLKLGNFPSDHGTPLTRASITA